MNIETLETKIKNRANEKTQDAIRAFVSKCVRAAKELRGYYPSDQADNDDRELIAIAAKKPGDREWPTLLWSKTEDALRKEILEKMDELQRISYAKEPAADDEKRAEVQKHE